MNGEVSTCKACGEVKPRNKQFFALHPECKDGMRKTCRKCQQNWFRAYDSRRDLPPLRKKAYRLRTGMKERSREFGLPFDDAILTVDYVEAWMRRSLACECCKRPFDYSKARSAAVDRLIPSKGYVVNNIALLCQRCNFIKSNAMPEELELVASWMRSKLSPRSILPAGEVTAS